MDLQISGWVAFQQAFLELFCLSALAEKDVKQETENTENALVGEEPKTFATMELIALPEAQETPIPDIAPSQMQEDTDFCELPVQMIQSIKQCEKVKPPVHKPRSLRRALRALGRRILHR